MLTTRLLKQGYKYDCLHSTFKKSSINIFHLILKQHVKEGIALPLNTVNRLDRLVTVR